MIEVFKIMHGYENIDRSQFFQTRPSRHDSRKHGLQIFPTHLCSSRRKAFFDARVIDSGNNLPADVVNSSCIVMFKNRLDVHLG